MQMNKDLCTFERVIIFKRISYRVYWPFMGFFLFIAGEILVRILNETGFTITRIVFSAAFGLIPVLIISSFYRFEKVMKDLSNILWDDNDEFESWLKHRMARIYTLKFWPSRIITVLISLGALFTILNLGLPFQSKVGNIIALLLFIPPLFVVGQSAYILLDSLFTLRDLSHRSANVPFYFQPHPAIRALQNGYSTFALVVALGYIFLAISIWQGPYGFSLEMQIWLTLLAFYPISMFFWSFYHVHILMQKIKSSHMKIINKEIQRALNMVLDGKKNDDVDRLERIMEIQDKVQAAKEWPIDFQGAFTFIATLITFLVQLFLSIRDILMA